MKMQGKSDTELLNNFIKYVICTSKGISKESKEGETKQVETKKETTLDSKAFSPDELVNSKGNLQIDVDWYSS